MIDKIGREGILAPTLARVNPLLFLRLYLRAQNFDSLKALTPVPHLVLYFQWIAKSSNMRHATVVLSFK